MKKQKSKIKFVTSRINKYPNSKFKSIHFSNESDAVQQFKDWAKGKDGFQLDTETPVIQDGPMQHDQRSLYVVQLGDLEKKTQYVFDMIDLDETWLHALIEVLISTQFKICHNAKFEYIVLFMNLGIRVENLHDTFLMSKMLSSGYDRPPGYNGYAGCVKRYLDIDIDKSAQTTFTGDPLTEEQIIYAATDVVSLYDLFQAMTVDLNKWGMYNLYDQVERQVMKAYADMELNPMRFDVKHWKELAQEIIKDATEMEETLEEEVFKDKALVKYLKTSKDVVLIQPKDEYKINWASTTFKKAALKELAPSLPDEIKTKPDLKKYLKDPDIVIPNQERLYLEMYMDRNYDKLNDELTNNRMKFLDDNGYYVREGTSLINWASPLHKLKIFNYYYPNLRDSNAKSLARIVTNPLITKFKRWTQANKNVTSYGENFIPKYVRDDETIAPFGLRQILATGRVSFGILLQIPAENRFRNAFLPPKEDWVFVDTDYSSAEVLIMASEAGETKFLDAVKQGKDLHSMSASLIYDDKWIDAAEPGCINLVDGSKCECKEHKKMRTFSKAITFGLAYGLSYLGLSDRLDISTTEAKTLFNKFFEAFPSFKKYFETNARHGVDYLYVSTMEPACRKRFFDAPERPDERSSIERKSKNFPIQGANADMLKVALVLLRNKIMKENLDVQLHLPIHDEVLSSCHKNFAEEWRDIQEKCMLAAADMFLEPGLMTADTNILNKWAKT